MPWALQSGKASWRRGHVSRDMNQLKEEVCSKGEPSRLRDSGRGARGSQPGAVARGRQRAGSQDVEGPELTGLQVTRRRPGRWLSWPERQAPGSGPPGSVSSASLLGGTKRTLPLHGPQRLRCAVGGASARRPWLCAVLPIRASGGALSPPPPGPRP